ncbi:hypothetical protein MMC14_010264 [Varicellaria rhodocarpa]|nr:hypothetical protein [Varicellaria rhodocarpa]
MVNVISWNRAYAVFPDITFVKDAAFSLLSPYLNVEPLEVLIFDTKDWTQYLSHGQDTPGPKQGFLRRSIGDRLTWTISFGTSKFAFPMSQRDELQYVDFDVNKKASSEGKEPRPTSQDVPGRKCEYGITMVW